MQICCNACDRITTPRNRNILFFQFIIGDTRVHEIPNLALNHLVWVQEHNRIATILNKINPHWNVEKVFQETRRIIIALVQHIAYNHYLPVVLDNQSMNRYRLYSRKTGYDDTYNKRIDASVCNGFAAAPFRFGHSQIMPHQTLLHDDYTTRNVTLLENNYNFPKLILEDQGANCPNFARWLVYTFSMKINK